MPEIWKDGYRCIEVSQSAPVWKDGYRSYNTLGLVTQSLITASDSIFVQLSELSVAAPVLFASDSIYTNITDALSSANVTLGGTESLPTSITESIAISVLVARVDSLLISLSEVGSFLQDVFSSDNITTNITEYLNQISVSLSKADSVSTNITEDSSISAILASLDTLTVSLVDLGFFFEDVFGVDTLSTNTTESSSLIGLISSTESINLSLLEQKDIYILLSVLDSLQVSISDFAYFFQDLASSDTLTTSVSDSSSLSVLLSRFDSLATSLTYTSSFFKELLYRDNIGNVVESVHIANFFTSIETILTNIQESKNLLCQLVGNDSASINITDMMSQVAVSIHIGDQINAALVDALKVGEEIFVTLGNTESVGVNISESFELKSYLESLDTISINLTEMRDILVHIIVNDATFVNLTEELQEIFVSLSKSESISVVDMVRVIDVYAETVRDSLTLGIADHILYNYPILSILKKVQTYTATIEKIQHISSIAKISGVDSDIVMVETDATLRETNKVDSDVDLKR